MTETGRTIVDSSHIDPTSSEVAAIEVDRLRQQHAQLERRLHDLALLPKITNRLHRSLDLDEIIRIFLTGVTAGSALGFNRAVLFRCEEPAGELVGWSAVGPLSGEEASHIWQELSGRQSFEHVVELATGERTTGGAFHDHVLRLRFPLAAGDSVLADVVLDGEAIRVDGARSDARVPRGLRELLDADSLVVAPLVASGRSLGAVVADNRFSGQAIGDPDIELLESLARHAGLAIERAREHGRVTRRLEERGRLHEISKGILTTIELDRELELIAQVSAQLMGADWSTVWLCRRSSPSVRLSARHGAGVADLDDGELETVAQIAQRAIDDDRPARAPHGKGQRCGEILCVPLFALDQPVGAIAVFAQPASAELDTPPFGEEEQEILALLGDQAAIAIQNARLFRRVRQTEGRLREAESIRARFETLAALGEMSAKVSHEIRTPLASIGGFARLLVPHFVEGSNERKAAEIIVSEVRRLERLLTTQLEYANLSKPDMRLCDLNEVVDKVIELVMDEAARHRVRLIRELAGGLPRLLLDPDHMKQVILNLAQNGFDWLPDGGRLRLTTRRMAAHVACEVATDGEPIAGDMLDRLFVPFSSARRGGSGLGLAVAHQIVREHGGQIRARSEGEWGAIFTVILPVRGNEDRRGGADRRQRQSDRRRALELESPAGPAPGATEARHDHGQDPDHRG